MSCSVLCHNVAFSDNTEQLTSREHVMTSRRTVLKGLSLGAGSVALSPFLNHFTRLDADDAEEQLPSGLCLS